MGVKAKLINLIAAVRTLMRSESLWAPATVRSVVRCFEADVDCSTAYNSEYCNVSYSKSWLYTFAGLLTLPFFP